MNRCPVCKRVMPTQGEVRSNDQNARMWAMLSDISKQVDWYGNHLTEDEWKDVFTASLKKQKVVPGIDSGTFVVIGARTSKMKVSEMGDLMELMQAFGNEKDVRFSAPKRFETERSREKAA